MRLLLVAPHYLAATVTTWLQFPKYDFPVLLSDCDETCVVLDPLDSLDGSIVALESAKFDPFVLPELIDVHIAIIVIDSEQVSPITELYLSAASDWDFFGSKRTHHDVIRVDGVHSQSVQVGNDEIEATRVDSHRLDVIL